MVDVYWWSRVRENNEKYENFGDALVPYLLDKMTSQRYKWIIPNSNRVLRIFKKKKHYIIIGSILRRATSHSVVWGGGIMFRDSVVPNAKFLAVRGPLTRERLVQLKYDVPCKYGDPGLLITLFNQSKKYKNFKFGFIPHFLDYNDVFETYRDNKEIKIINLLTNQPQNIIDEINDCEFIISSSLHGIIVPHALGIPSLWMKVSEKLQDDIKFYDYYASLDIKAAHPLSFGRYTLEEFKDMFENYSEWTLPKRENLNQVLKDLIETFPFKKSKQFKKAIKTYFG